MPAARREEEWTHLLSHGGGKTTGSWYCVFHDPGIMKGAIADPVLDLDPLAGEISTANAERLLGSFESR